MLSFFYISPAFGGSAALASALASFFSAFGAAASSSPFGAFPSSAFLAFSASFFSSSFFFSSAFLASASATDFLVSAVAAAYSFFSSSFASAGGLARIELSNLTFGPGVIPIATILS